MEKIPWKIAAALVGALAVGCSSTTVIHQQADGGVADPGDQPTMGDDGGGEQTTGDDGGAQPTGNDAGAATDGNAQTDSGDVPQSGGLAIVNATVNVQALDLPASYNWEPARTGATTAKFVAIVTHTAGRDAIAGGTLEDDTGATYSAFQIGSTNGTYEVSIDVPTINQVRSIDTTPGADTRTFVVKFFDNSGNSATKSLPLRLKCGDSGTQGAKASVCHDLTLDGLNCGSHGKACPRSADSLSLCIQSSCQTIPTVLAEGSRPCMTISELQSAAGDGLLKIFTRTPGSTFAYAYSSCDQGHNSYYTSDMADYVLPDSQALSFLFTQ